MNELIKKFGAFSVGPFVGAILGILTVPAITYFISPAEYGKSSMFVLAQSALAMVMYLGMDQAYVREFNSYRDNKSILMSNALIVPLFLVAVIDILILFNNAYISQILFDNRNELMPVISLTIMLPFMIFENFALLNIRMQEKGLQYSFFTILLKTLTLVFTLLLLFTYERTFRSVIYAIAIAETVNGIVLSILTLKNVRISCKCLDKELITRMLKFGLPLVPASILGWVLTSTDKVMLRTMCSYSELGLYSAAFKLANALGIIQTCFTLFWTPVSYRWYEAGKDNKSFEKVSTIISLLMTVLCLVLLLLKQVMVIILGHNYEGAIYIFPFLLLYPIMYTMSESTAMGIGFTRSTAYNILISALSGGMNIIMNYYFIPIFEGKGAAMATGFSYIVFFWARTLISRKLWYKFDINKYIVYTIVILLNCAAHTFCGGLIPYLISTISIVIILVVNYNTLKEIIYLLMKNKGSSKNRR